MHAGFVRVLESFGKLWKLIMPFLIMILKDFKMIATTINIEDELEKKASFISFMIYRLSHY